MIRWGMPFLYSKRDYLALYRRMKELGIMTEKDRRFMSGEEEEEPLDEWMMEMSMKRFIDCPFFVAIKSNRSRVDLVEIVSFFSVVRMGLVPTDFSLNVS